jgi:SAM-dependent methyltransferase
LSQKKRNSVLKKSRFMEVAEYVRLKVKKKSARVDCDYVQPNFEGGDLNAWIAQGIRGYQQWYQPVEFGDGLKAHVTIPPDWHPNSELDKFSGLNKWNFIVKRNIPDIRGLRVLDVGCNVGVFSIELSRLGAREVIGVDRDLQIPHKPDYLPRQDIVSQAKFVREAISLKTGEILNIEYLPMNFSSYESFTDLGSFDLILALNVAYHELGGMEPMLKTLASMTNTLVLQTSLSHGPPIKEWASLSTHVEILTRIGFTSICIDAPLGYEEPVIVARK